MSTVFGRPGTWTSASSQVTSTQANDMASPPSPGSTSYQALVFNREGFGTSFATFLFSFIVQQSVIRDT